jgi:hypothetical protein
MFFRVQRKNRVRDSAPSHASMLIYGAEPLIRRLLPQGEKGVPANLAIPNHSL